MKGLHFWWEVDVNDVFLTGFGRFTNKENRLFDFIN
jgi:hypothetical protein